MVTTDEIKQLRDKTGVSVMQCKKALEEAGGDMEKALIILAKQASASAEKKSERDLGAGTIAAYIHGEGSVGAMVELSCETDFVAKNEDFKKLAYELAMQVAATSPKYLSEDDIDDQAKEKAKEVFADEIKDLLARNAQASKPADLQEKILSGKLSAYFDEKTLLKQAYIKDDSKTIGGLINEAVQKFGERTEIRRFSRFSVSE